MKLRTKYSNTIRKEKDGVISYFLSIREELLSDMKAV